MPDEESFSILLDLIVQDDQWNDDINFVLFDQIAKTTLEVGWPLSPYAMHMIKQKEIIIELILTNDTAIQEVNKTYRGFDKPTNVLSFAAFDPSTISLQTALLLGNILLSFNTIQNEAIQQEKSFHDHVCHLLIHGCLHLMGFDHETDQDAEIMEPLEVSILEKFNIKNPYCNTV